MKQVVLRIEDSAYENFKAFLNLCPSIEMVSEFSDLEVRKQLDVCIEQAIHDLLNNKVIRRPSDYTYIMQVINEEKVKDAPYFKSPDAFIDYLKELGIKNLPSRTTLYDTNNLMGGCYPKWRFKDSQIDGIESLRRNNVARKFLSALFKAQRTFSDGFSDKV